VVRLGTAGWTVPRAVADRFPSEGTGLERYAAVFNGAEINSTFYKPHRASTLERWAATVPDDFRFAAKIPKTITHEARLVDTAELFARFVEEMTPLGSKLGPLLVQLPPSLVFDPAVAAAFFAHARGAFTGALACEPRHPTWFEFEADALLRDHHVARVAADPARVPEAARPAGWEGLRYWRLHGSPRMYYSSYEPGYLAELTADLAAGPVEAWCVFDNTVSGAAAANALQVRDLLTP
jgi:uncharacterized protein YecE (DUF72 family)